MPSPSLGLWDSDWSRQRRNTLGTRVFIVAPVAGVLCNPGGLSEMSCNPETRLEGCRSYQASSGSSPYLGFGTVCLFIEMPPVLAAPMSSTLLQFRFWGLGLSLEGKGRWTTHAQLCPGPWWQKGCLCAAWDFRQREWTSKRLIPVALVGHGQRKLNVPSMLCTSDSKITPLCLHIYNIVSVENCL